MSSFELAVGVEPEIPELGRLRQRRRAAKQLCCGESTLKCVQDRDHHFGIAAIVRRACLNRIRVEPQSCIRGSVANDDYVLFVPSGFSLSAFYVQLA
jgi:hypothetical protein